MLDLPDYNHMIGILKKKLSYYLLLAFLGGFLILGIEQFPSFKSQVMAQGIINPEDVSAIIYQKIPDIALENQYIRKDSGEVDPDHTLISRFVRYHRDVQKRMMRSRFDWKLSFADYLGANESIKADRYPGHDTLRENPLENDLKAIGTLNRRQRQAVVDLLVSIYEGENPDPMSNSADNAESKPELPSESNSVNETTPNPSNPPLSQPGDAQLLMP